MSAATLAGLIGAALVGLGLYGLIVNPEPLRKVLAFNLIGSGVFLVFGIVARRGAAAGLPFDPVPQAMVITGIVVAFAASALAVALILRLEEETGEVELDSEAPAEPLGRQSGGVMIETPPALAATAGGSLLVLAILLPAAGILMSFVLGGRFAERIALGILPFGLALAVAIAVLVGRSGAPIVYNIAGLPPPLGIALRADGISAVMLVTAALVIAAAAPLRPRKFCDAGGRERGARSAGVLDHASGDLGGADPSVRRRGPVQSLCRAGALDLRRGPAGLPGGKPETLVAALRYLMFALFGSVFYLLGAALFYGAYGTLDIVLLAERVRPLPAVWLAAGLMTAGLLAKTALFPLHLWLPPAHANAPAAASAVLSGLVVKGSFFLTVRLWFYVLPALPAGAVDAVLGTLGSAAILFGSVLALRQERLKLLIAYSTLAQIGYLFLIFPLAFGLHSWTTDGWSGGLMQTLSHAFAKAAMFLSAGLIAELLGHDRIGEFAGAGRAMPATFFALGLGGLSLMGLPPSGGFAAKWLLLRASVAAGQWPWAMVMLAGGLLAAGYVYRILAPALSDGAPVLKSPPQRSREARRAGAGARGGGARIRAAIVFRFSPDRPRGRDGAAMTGMLGPWLLAGALAAPARVPGRMPLGAPAQAGAFASMARADPRARRRDPGDRRRRRSRSRRPPCA